MKAGKFRFFRQLESLDCAPTCLKMVANYYGREYTLDYLRDICKSNRLGTSVYSLSTGAEKIGLETLAVELKIEQLTEQLPLPCALLINNNHFIILNKIITKKGLFKSEQKYLIADPGFGMLTIGSDELRKKWMGSQENGVCIFFEPDESFYTLSNNSNRYKWVQVPLGLKGPSSSRLCFARF